MKRYPFKFLDSYSREDKGIFFGRDEEVETLYEMVFQSPVMVIYGASGTGKTSLINCGLAGRFEPHDWLALMIRRGNNINESLVRILKDTVGFTAGNTSMAYATNLSDKKENEASTVKQAGIVVKQLYEKYFKPIYLIFDQFEELFILGSSAEAHFFYDTIADILQSEQPVKLIFSIREEYLGHLFEFERKVPQLLRKKLRIEPMNLEKIKQVIKGVSASEYSNISVPAAEEDHLAEGIFNKIKGSGKTLTIQLPFLQVFLDKFYLNITNDESRQANAEFNLKQLDTMGEIGDVLINFLEDQVNSISKKLSNLYPGLTEEMTWKILSPFATPEGTREPISRQGLHDSLPGHDSSLINAVLEQFVNSRILRYNELIDMFEIAHDALAKPISEKRSVEEKALLEIRKLIKNQVAVNEDARAYFTERQLIFIEPFLNKFKQTREESDWIKKSRQFIQEQNEAEAKKQLEEFAKRKRILKLIYLVIFLVFIIILGSLGFWYYLDSREVIKKRDLDIEAKRDSLKESRLEAITAEATVDSIKEAFKNDPGALAKINKSQEKASAIVLQPRIYMHIHSESSRPEMRKIAEFLKTKGYIIPGIEAVNESFEVMQLRYFRQADTITINEIAENLRYLGYRVKPQYISGYEASKKIRQNHFEIWWK